MEKAHGLTLRKLVLFVAIIGILTTIAMPAYQNYSRRAVFSELVLAVTSRKAAVELAIQTRNPFALTDLDGRLFGIPANVAVNDTTHGGEVADGVITMTWRSDSTDLDGITYKLAADGITAPVQWSKGGSCLDKGLC